MGVSKKSGGPNLDPQIVELLWQDQTKKAPNLKKQPYTIYHVLTLVLFCRLLGSYNRKLFS